MEHIDYVEIDYDATATRLKQLRLYNMNLHRYVCFELRTLDDELKCDGENCENCVVDDRKNSFINSQISQEELARVFHVNVSQVANWETGRSFPSLENLIFYCRICKIKSVEELVVMKQ